MYKSKVCPRCQSWETEEVFSGLESEIICKKCGFRFKASSEIKID